MVEEYPDQRIKQTVKAYYGRRGGQAVPGLLRCRSGDALDGVLCWTEDDWCPDCLVTGS